jgi:hypothetical protein
MRTFKTFKPFKRSSRYLSARFELTVFLAFPCCFWENGMSINAALSHITGIATHLFLPNVLRLAPLSPQSPLVCLCFGPY